MSATVPPGIVHVMQAGDVAATRTVSGAWLAAGIDALQARHPDVRLVAVKCLIVGAILLGDVEGPYDPR